MKIIIGGDIVATESNKEYLNEGKVEEILDSNVINMLKQADLRMFNLENPMGKSGKTIDKWGNKLIADIQMVNSLKRIETDFVFLANNHIMDYGKDGLESTINVLKENNIEYTGIIDNSNVEYYGYIIERDGIKIGFYNLCENEFSVATEFNKGANPLNLLKNCYEIEQLKDKVDYVIVIFHGGKEFYRYPSPDIQKICRNFVDCGADCVIMQHSHCIGCQEIYKNKTIIYGQGNFIFDRRSNEFWDSELLIEIEIKDNFKIKYYPVEKKDGKYYYSKGENILKEFFERSEKIKDKNFIQNEYKKIAHNLLPMYLSYFNRNTLIKRLFNKITKNKYILNKYSKNDCLAILNFIQCEAHREMLIEGLKEKINDEK